MKKEIIISFFLVAIFVLQLFPVKQAINYFFVDNVMVEEIVNTAKTPVKPPTVIDEDQIANDLNFLEHPFLFNGNVLSCLYKDMLPSLHADDVETPPPNGLDA